MQELTAICYYFISGYHLNHQLNYHLINVSCYLRSNKYQVGLMNLTLDLILIKTKILHFLLKESHNLFP